jgi:hypothetical protein
MKKFWILIPTVFCLICSSEILYPGGIYVNVSSIIDLQIIYSEIAAFECQKLIHKAIFLWKSEEKVLPIKDWKALNSFLGTYVDIEW